MNIYSSKIYLAFTAISLFLIVFGLYHIFVAQDIKLGVDFRGGSLVVVDSKQNIEKEQLASALESKGLQASVNKFETPFGYRYEIEVPNPEYIYESEQYRLQFETTLSEYSQAILRDEKDKAEEINAKLLSLTNQMEDLAISLGIDVNKTDSTNVNDMKDAFYSAYNKIHNNYESSIKASVGEFLSPESFSLQIVSPLLSGSFTKNAINIAIISALLVSAYVFFYFRQLVPSIAVLVGAFSDLIIAIGGMAYFGIPLTLTSFAALLMITGYSLDTDTLLTIRMIKRRDGLTPEEKAQGAFNTGINMSTTALLAFSVVLVLSLVFRIALYYEIAGVALIGLIGDIFATWGINAVILLNHIKRKG